MEASTSSKDSSIVEIIDLTDRGEEVVDLTTDHESEQNIGQQRLKSLNMMVLFLRKTIVPLSRRIKRPPLSVKSLVSVALLLAPEKKLTFCQIKKYILDNFAYYRDQSGQLEENVKQCLKLNPNKFRQVGEIPGLESDDLEWTIKRKCQCILALEAVKEVLDAKVPVVEEFHKRFAPNLKSQIESRLSCRKKTPQKEPNHERLHVPNGCTAVKSLITPNSSEEQTSNSRLSCHKYQEEIRKFKRLWMQNGSEVTEMTPNLHKEQFKPNSQDIEAVTSEFPKPNRFVITETACSPPKEQILLNSPLEEVSNHEKYPKPNGCVSSEMAPVLFREQSYPILPQEEAPKPNGCKAIEIKVNPPRKQSFELVSKPQETLFESVVNAITLSVKGYCTLDELYKSLAEKHKYYQQESSKWKKSILELLSKERNAFIHIPGGDDNTGHWTLHPRFTERRPPIQLCNETENQPPTKTKVDTTNVLYKCKKLSSNATVQLQKLNIEKPVSGNLQEKTKTLPVPNVTKVPVNEKDSICPFKGFRRPSTEIKKRLKEISVKIKKKKQSKTEIASITHESVNGPVSNVHDMNIRVKDDGGILKWRGWDDHFPRTKSDRFRSFVAELENSEGLSKVLEQCEQNRGNINATSGVIRLEERNHHNFYRPWEPARFQEEKELSLQEKTLMKSSENLQNQLESQVEMFSKRCSPSCQSQREERYHGCWRVNPNVAAETLARGIFCKKSQQIYSSKMVNDKKRKSDHGENLLSSNKNDFNGVLKQRRNSLGSNTSSVVKTTSLNESSYKKVKTEPAEKVTKASYCVFCEEKFTCAFLLECHTKTHTQLAFHPCYRCHEFFSSKHMLLDHQLVNHRGLKNEHVPSSLCHVNK